MRRISINEIMREYLKKNKISKFQPPRTLVKYLNLEVENSSNELDDLRTEPVKKYEVFETDNPVYKLLLGCEKYLPKGDSTKQELYFSKDIALEIYRILTELDDNAINSQPEIMAMYQDEINKKHKKLEELKNEDELKFKKAVALYNTIEQDEMLRKIIGTYYKLKKENNYLQSKIIEDENEKLRIIRKLQISMNKYEELKNKKISFWEKLYLKICLFIMH